MILAAMSSTVSVLKIDQKWYLKLEMHNIVSDLFLHSPAKKLRERVCWVFICRLELNVLRTCTIHERLEDRGAFIARGLCLNPSLLQGTYHLIKDCQKIKFKSFEFSLITETTAVK